MHTKLCLKPKQDFARVILQLTVLLFFRLLYPQRIKKSSVNFEDESR